MTISWLCDIINKEKEIKMKKLTENIYKHKGYFITKDSQGISVEGHLELFASFNDAKEFVNKITNGSNKKEPVIVGKWHSQNFL